MIALTTRVTGGAVLQRQGARALVRGAIVVLGLVAIDTPALANYIQDGTFAATSASGTFSAAWVHGGNLAYSNTCNTNCLNVGGYVNGTSYAELGPIGSNGTLTQTFTLPSSGTYRLSFSLAMTNLNATGVDSFSALINTAVVFGPLTNQNDFGFRQESALFQGNSGTDTLTFSFRQDPGYFALTNISIDAAPQPVPGSGLLAYGLIALIGLGRLDRRARHLVLVGVSKSA
jgi:hypothetical protein